jgi:hypothetical protein
VKTFFKSFHPCLFPKLSIIFAAFIPVFVPIYNGFMFCPLDEAARNAHFSRSIFRGFSFSLLWSTGIFASLLGMFRIDEILFNADKSRIGNEFCVRV